MAGRRRIGLLRMIAGAALFWFGARATYKRVRHGRLGPLSWIVPGTLFWGASSLLGHPVRQAEHMMASGMGRLGPATRDVADIVAHRVRKIRLPKVA